MEQVGQPLRPAIFEANGGLIVAFGKRRGGKYLVEPTESTQSEPEVRYPVQYQETRTGMSTGGGVRWQRLQAGEEIK